MPEETRLRYKSALLQQYAFDSIAMVPDKQLRRPDTVMLRVCVEFFPNGMFDDSFVEHDI